ALLDIGTHELLGVVLQEAVDLIEEVIHALGVDLDLPGRLDLIVVVVLASATGGDLRLPATHNITLLIWVVPGWNMLIRFTLVAVLKEQTLGTSLPSVTVDVAPSGSGSAGPPAPHPHLRLCRGW